MYRNDRTERARIYKLWVIEQDRPCTKCGSKDRREVAHIIPFHQGGTTSENNLRVLCRRHNIAETPNSKFRIGDRVVLNGRTPACIDLARHRPRTVIAIRYSPDKRCNYYLLGSNGRGNNDGNGNPLEGYSDYLFRSYMLHCPRRYHHHRQYNRHNHDKSTCDKQGVVETTQAILRCRKG